LSHPLEFKALEDQLLIASNSIDPNTSKGIEKIITQLNCYSTYMRKKTTI